MNRQNIPRNIQKKIYYESCGYCMNPSCNFNLSENNCGEIAHIISVSDGGDDSEKNLIHLCSNCHAIFDKNTNNWKVDDVRDWKKNRQEMIEGQFALDASDFEHLKRLVIPLLNSNKKNFEDYGPHNESNFLLWKKFESKIISNNRKIELLLNKNINLLHGGNKKIVEIFIQHSHEFVNTRDDSPAVREVLFPEEILSIFGLKEVNSGIVNNLSALQNFISYVQKEHRYIGLDLLTNPPVLKYKARGGAEVEWNLTNTPHINQELFNGFFFRPKNNVIRLESLIFFLRWIDDKNIKYEFNKLPDLSRLMLNDDYEVQLFYEYILSVSCLHNKESKNLICVNLHIWNGAPCTEEAIKYAKNFNMKLLNQNEFFQFAHKYIK